MRIDHAAGITQIELGTDAQQVAEQLLEFLAVQCELVRIFAHRCPQVDMIVIGQAEAEVFLRFHSVTSFESG